MRYYIKPAQLHEASKKVSDEIKNEFIEKADKLISISKKLEWEGSSKEKFISSFNTKVNKLKQFSNIIDGIGNFMSYCSKKYDNSTDEVENECLRYDNKTNKI